MVLRKSPNNVSTEELLKQLKTTEEIPEEQLIKEENEQSSIDFIRFFNLKPGNERIGSHDLYKLYSLWYRGNEKLRSLQFSVQVGKYLPRYTGDGKSWYLIDEKLIDLHERAFKLIKKEKKRYKSPNVKADFDNYLKKYNISKGTKYNFTWIAGEVLYSLYDEYAYGIKKKKPLSEQQFLKLCKIYFPDYKRDEKILWFNIHDSISNIMTAERISAIMTGRSQRRAKEKKQKKQYRASSS